jgi:hypothetical protein
LRERSKGQEGEVQVVATAKCVVTGPFRAFQDEFACTSRRDHKQWTKFRATDDDPSSWTAVLWSISRPFLIASIGRGLNISFSVIKSRLIRRQLREGMAAITARN